jgi:hypothetical protein
LAHERETLLKKIRTIDGFDSFLSPQKLSQLAPAADAGPVVVLNASTIRCDALVLFSSVDDVLHIPLPGMSLDLVEGLQKSLKSLIKSSGRSISHDVDRKAKLVSTDARPKDSEEEFRRILSHLWTLIAKPVLAGLGFNVGLF